MEEAEGKHDKIHLGHAHKHQVRPRLSPIAPRLIWSILAIVLLLSFVLARLALPSNTALPRPRLVRQDHKPLQRTIELLPLPANYTVGSSVICLSDNFSIIVDPTINSIIPQDLQRAIDRTLDAIRLSRHTYLSIEHGEEFRLAGCNNTLSTLVLRLTLDQDVEPSTRDIPSIWDGAIVAPEERPSWESYTLDIPLHGNAAISSRTVLGLFRGLTSFANLVYFLPDDLVGDEVTGKGKGYHYLPFAPYRIEDKPSFGWRSVLLDTSRNFYSVRCIQKASLAGLGYCAMADGQILDAMSMVKLNVFHWHITDSQSWPLHLSSMPELASRGSYGKTKQYSESDVKGLVAYAGERDSVDLPGSKVDTVFPQSRRGQLTLSAASTSSSGLIRLATRSIFHSHPDFVACYGASWTKYAHEPPAELFEASAELVKGNFFGTGGDEINEACVYADPQTNATLAANNWTLLDALDHFTNETHSILRKRGKTPVVWEEMVLERNLSGIAPDTIVDVWIDSANAKKVADKGFKFVHASSEYYYLDCGHGAWIGLNGGGKSWCDPYKDWQHIYSFDPYANITEAQKPLVLGGQVSVWSEQTDENNIENILFPRANALAELFWTGAGESGYPRSSIDAFPRMHDARYRMVDRGIRAGPLQPEWCALRPGSCNVDS